MRTTSDAIEKLRSNGVAAAVSGAGPAVVCLVVRGEEESVRAVGLGEWDIRELEWNREGARVIES
jgi:shikimate kinase